MLRLLRLRLIEVLKAVVPLIAAVSLLQLTIVQAPAALFVQFLVGSVFAVAGMMLLFMGIEVGILPMGRYIGAALPGRASLWLIVAVAFALGFATTAAEPDVLVLAAQVAAASTGGPGAQTLIYIIAAGVGLFTAFALLRVLAGVSVAKVLTVVYALMIVLTLFAPDPFVSLAYDAGSVTTGVLTAPVILAFALGFTSVLAQRSAVTDGFGLLGLASVGPIIAVLVLGILQR